MPDRVDDEVDTIGGPVAHLFPDHPASVVDGQLGTQIADIVEI